jgi:hypothetical protein
MLADLAPADGPELSRTSRMARVSRPAYDPRCYRLPPRKPLPSREALVLWIIFSRFGKLPIFGCFVPQIISPIHVAPSSTPEDVGDHSTTG